MKSSQKIAQKYTCYPFFYCPFFYFSLFIFSSFLLSCSGSDDNKEKILETTHNEKIAEHKSNDPTYLKYEDSLARYFGDVEIDLIVHYQHSQESLKTPEDFSIFFRNTSTLRNSLVKRLKQYTDDQKLKGKTKVHPMPWFKELAPGLDIGVVKDSTAYDIFYNYKIWEEFASKTTGEADDEFMKLLLLCCSDYSYQPNWVTVIGEQSCSQLGSGKHFSALQQINVILDQNQLFMKEIAKIKNMIMADLLFGHYYCENSKKATDELNKILKSVSLKETETKMLKGRVQQFAEPKKYKIQFGCIKGNCDYNLATKNEKAE
jgi:hypothetical protein